MENKVLTSVEYSAQRVLTPVEYSAQRVLTTEQLAQAYECDANNIKKNFNANKERFEEGKHYFKLEGEELSKLRVTFGDLQISPMTRTLYLWTKRGAARHSKMLGTDKAWEVFEALEESYFESKDSLVQPVLPSVNQMTKDIIQTAEALDEYLGLKKGMAFVHATVLCEKRYGFDFTPLKKLIPPAEHETGYMNATQLGEKVGKSAKAVNKWLSDNGYQYKDESGWRLTDLGKRYAEEYPYTRNGHSGYQIKWSKSVVSILH